MITHSSCDGFAYEDVCLRGPYCAYCWIRNSRERPSFPVARCRFNGTSSINPKFSRFLIGRGAKFCLQISRTLMKREEARSVVPNRCFHPSSRVSFFYFLFLWNNETTSTRLYSHLPLSFHGARKAGVAFIPLVLFYLRPRFIPRNCSGSLRFAPVWNKIIFPILNALNDEERSIIHAGDRNLPA